MQFPVVATISYYRQTLAVGQCVGYADADSQPGEAAWAPEDNNALKVVQG